MILPAVALAAALPSAAASLPALVPGDLYLWWGNAPGEDGATVVHRYRDAVLIALDPAAEPPAGAAVRCLANPDRASYGGWSGVVPAASDAAAAAPGDWVVLTLTGPADTAWLAALTAAGNEIIAPVHPSGVLVRATGEALARAFTLTTSEGFRVVRGAVGLPHRARVAPSLWPQLSRRTAVVGPIEALIADGAGRRPRRQALAPGAAGSDLAALLDADPTIRYLAPPLAPVAHLDLAVGAELAGIEPVWQQLGLDGGGLVVAHNDTGVDLRHPDLPAAAVVATLGRMAYTNNAHGTHTASILVGRGGAPAPPEGGGCPPLYPPLAEVRGIAAGARLATNNLFDGGAREIAAMMAWGVRLGAVVSSNSWGLVGSGDDGRAYSIESAAVDAAVRDADPATATEEPLTIVFSAGNLGPFPATVTAPGTAKSAITVGATQNARCGSFVPGTDPGPDPARVLSTSSRGPAQDRVKPDLVAPGGEILAAGSSDFYADPFWDQDWTGPRYDLATGTSQAAAVVAGAAVLVHQQRWRQRGVPPSPALVKAALIAGATDLGLAPAIQGWGRLDLARTLLGPSGGHSTLLDADVLPALASGTSWQHELAVASAAVPLTVALVWSDVPGEPGADHPLVNDLDLELLAPTGTRYRGNRFDGSWSAPDPGPDGNDDDTVELIRIAAPTPGTWQLLVRGVGVPSPPAGLTGQDFALAIVGDATTCAAPPPPAAVAAAAVAPNQVELTWQGVAGATSYLVRRTGWPGDGPPLPVARITAPATSWSDTTVDGGLEYRYLVEAELDPVCRSAPSMAAVVTATGGCAAAPLFAGLAAVAPATTTSCGLVLRWDAATAPCGGPLGYDVYRTTTEGPVVTPANLAAAGLTGLEWRDGDVADGDTVRYVVRARDQTAGSSDDNLVERAATAVGPSRTWLAADPDDDPAALVATPASDNDPGSDPWAVNGDDAGAGTLSWSCRSATTVKDQALVTAVPLTLPAGLGSELEFRHRTALDPGHDGGVLEYSTNGGASWYDIQAGDGAAVAADPARMAEGGYNDLLADDNPLAGAAAWSGHSRQWQWVRVSLDAFARRPLLLRWRLATAGREAGGGWWVDQVRVRAATSCQHCPTPPAPPAEVVAHPTAAGIAVDWRPSVTGASHIVERAPDDGLPLLPIALTGAGTTSYLDRTVSGGSRYRYAVRSVAATCWSEPSAETTAVAGGDCRLPPEFYGLSAAISPPADGCTITLEWAPAIPRCSGDPVRYRVYRSPSPTVEPGHNADLIAIVGGTAFTDLRVVPDRRYSYLVRAVHEHGEVEDANLRVLGLPPRGPDEVAFADGGEDALAGWRTATGSAADSGTEPWHTTTDDAVAGTHALMVAGEPRLKDQVLELAAPVSLVAGTAPVLEFWHRYDHELFWDGGRLEYTSDDGVSWHDILDGDGQDIPADAERFLEGGYSGTLQNSANPLAGRRAWTGWLGVWAPVRVDLRAFVGHTVKLRWRIGCDASRARPGWWVDEVRLAWPLPCTPSPLAPRRGTVRPAD